MNRLATLVRRHRVCTALTARNQKTPATPPNTHDADVKAIQDNETQWNADWAARTPPNFRPLHRRRRPDGFRRSADQWQGRHPEDEHSHARRPSDVSSSSSRPRSTSPRPEISAIARAPTP